MTHLKLVGLEDDTSFTISSMFVINEIARYKRNIFIRNKKTSVEENVFLSTTITKHTRERLHCKQNRDIKINN